MNLYHKVSKLTMYITNKNTGNSINTNNKLEHTQQSNYLNINKYSRNNSQWSHHSFNKKINPNYLLYEIPEQYTSRSNSNSTTANDRSKQNPKNKSLFKNNYQISFNQNKRLSIDDSNLVSSRKDSKNSMSPGSRLFTQRSRGSIAISDDSSTLVNSSITKSKVNASSAKSLLDLVSEYEGKSETSEDINTHKQLRITQKLNMLKQNYDKDFLDGFRDTDYFYSDIKFINDEINHQFNNMKLLKSRDVLNVKKQSKFFIYNKYLDVLKNKNTHRDESTFYIAKPDDIVSQDQLNDIIEKAWLSAETSTSYLPKVVKKE